MYFHRSNLKLSDHASCPTSDEEQWRDPTGDVTLLSDPRVAGPELPRDEETEDA